MGKDLLEEKEEWSEKISRKAEYHSEKNREAKRTCYTWE